MSEDRSLLIVIPCLNEERDLPIILDQLLRDNSDVLIVVADGGSTDRSWSIVNDLAVSDPRLILMDNPARIQSAGVNAAVERFAGDRRWLLRIDAHCSYPPSYAQLLLDAAEARQATSVVVPMVSRGITCFQKAAAAAQNSRLGTGGSKHRHVGKAQFVDHGHHALMRLDLFRAVGGYREDMSHNEDAELDLRLVRANGRIWIEPAAAIVYWPRGFAIALWRQYCGYGSGRARTMRLHRQRPKLRQVIPPSILCAALVALASPFLPALGIPVLSWIVATLVFGAFVGVRSGGGCAMMAGVPAAIMHLAWGWGFFYQKVVRPRSRVH